MMTLDDWNTVLQVASVVILGVTFLIGAGALWTSYVINQRQSERIAAMEQDTAKASKAAADANERAGKLEVEAASQRERAAKAEKELLLLQERVKPRTLAAGTRQALIDALRKAPSNGNVIIACVDGDSESCAFANQIRACFIEAGWPIQGELAATLTLTGFGVVIRVRDAKSPPKHATAIVRAFGSAALPISDQSAPEMPADRVMLWIGSKR